jgi:putative protease
MSPPGDMNLRQRTFCDAMAKQKFHPTRLGVFSGAKAYIVYVEVLEKYRNAVGRTFCDAIMI